MSDKPGLKLTNERSRFAKTTAAKREFEGHADEVMSERGERNKRAFDLAQKYLKMLAEKTLPENRSVLVSNIEKEIESNLLALAVEVNNDETEPNEGMGSIALAALLFKTVISQRDRLNVLEYKIAKLEKQLGSSVQDVAAHNGKSEED